MKTETIPFMFIKPFGSIKKGDEILFDDGPGIVTSIQSVELLKDRDSCAMKVIGRYKKKVNYVDQLLNQFGRNK
ncbi:hypothetical protein PDN54_08135 [Bacillus cereus group sp. Bc252]|uniref:hypothetical protein n=1 Tax=Bacillus TaxID=1386 RepID=UPI0021CFBB55|nr:MULTISPECIES: hypothetical protein [Bacillus cereus group]MCU5206758.1 hypothetical protein [Bacillus paranthracis]MDA2160262.1 hypothetical protein [Bacillus cereus group sp. Bc252]HDR7786438.1 hypothetical protein [Bacillus paranthracis]